MILLVFYVSDHEPASLLRRKRIPNMLMEAGRCAVFTETVVEEALQRAVLSDRLIWIVGS
jgi:hypothetical protein